VLRTLLVDLYVFTAYLNHGIIALKKAELNKYLYIHEKGRQYMIVNKVILVVAVVLRND